MKVNPIINKSSRSLNWTGSFSVLLAAFFVFGSVVEAQKLDSKRLKKSRNKPVASIPDRRLKKDVSFDDYAVKGKYLVPLNSVTVVEEDKTIDDLIGVRRNFDDRVEATKEMR